MVFRDRVDGPCEAAQCRRLSCGEVISDRPLSGKTGANIIPDLLEGMRIVSVISGLFQKDVSSQGASQSPSPDLGSDLDLFALPAPMLEAMLGVHRSMVCLAALVALGLSNRFSPPNWLVSRVVRGWVEGNRSFLRLIAMMYDNEDVPEDLLPKEQRLDRQQMIQHHNDVVAMFEQFSSAASAL